MAADVLVRIAQPVSNIMDDEQVADVLETLSGSRDVPYIKLISAMLPKVVPLALKSHRNDLYEVVGALENKPASAVGKANIMETMAVLRDSIDQDLIDFFKSTGGQDVTAGEE
jgi:hypothetical protein